MIVVGIETSGSQGSVALLREGAIVDERLLGDSGRRHARTLVMELDEVLGGQGLTPREIDVVAVSLGPGSFTGLRVGVVCAKTWAFATGCRLAAVETFVAVAARLPAESQGSTRAWVIDDALREDVFVQRFERADAGGDSAAWRGADAVRLMAFDAWIHETAAGDLVSGPGAGRWAAELRDRGLDVVAPERQRPAAAAVAEVGAALALRGEHADPFTLAPLYVRRSAAEEKLDAAARAEPATGTGP
ncbi:MAG: tRNA (adenosine(37)-N6)-threonylcarbamoyltransferase complex dimerization subunit type 1 TsaB [Planctomyces sp.]|nr:tRNA (adenosine(37)-N6)-threonylcarbamoyltransferase complex dimerization subunit type 1 TsaB [Planctomyces sp.]